MIPDLQYYLNRPYTIHVVPDCGTYGEQLYFASVTELPGCESHGGTPEEAARNLRDAMCLYIGSMLEDGLVPPEPQEFGVSVVWSVHAQGQRPHIPGGAGLTGRTSLAHV
jgi:predicted RNase H-like HicB family nuclease